MNFFKGHNVKKGQKMKEKIVKEKIRKKTWRDRFSIKFNKDIFYLIFLTVLTVLFLTTFVFQSVQNSKFKKQVEALALLSARGDIVYVYSPETLVAQSPEILAMKENYTKRVNELTKEIEEAGQKIKNFKNEKVKEDFSDIYLQSLIAKRNDLVGGYQQKLQEITSKVNQALENVMNANNIPAVFDSKVLLGRSNKVIDITSLVAQNFEALIKEK